MGRLFWKLFFAFLGALALAALLVALAFSTLWPRTPGGPGAPHLRNADTALRLLQRNGPGAVSALLEVWRAQGAPAPWVFDPDGRDVLGRPHPADLPHDVMAVQIDGRVWRVAPARAPGPPSGGGLPLPPPPFVEIVALLIGALAFSAALAAYLSRPVRHLHAAFDTLAGGELDARVAARMGGRRDEIADLGRHFDRMAARLQQSMTAQRQLLHDVSHELRSPLARLTAAVGLARQGGRSMDETCDRIEREVARLDALVGQVLGLSRAEHDAGRSAPVRLALDALIEDVVDDARFEASGCGVQVLLQAVPCEASGQAELLKSALDNVLRNALRHAPRDSLVRVTLSRSDGAARIAVEDSGCGVPPDALERIFDPFFRGERSDGSGLGLAIARRAIEAHGGHIAASLRPEGGLRMEIVLPVGAAGHAVDERPAV